MPVGQFLVFLINEKSLCVNVENWTQLMTIEFLYLYEMDKKWLFVWKKKEKPKQTKVERKEKESI